MDSKGLACWTLLFQLLIVLVSASAGHMMHQLDPRSTPVFFAFSDFKLGTETTVFFPDGDPTPWSSPYLWPKQQADAIPFSLEELPEILRHFSIPQGSHQAQVMEHTLRSCEAKPVKGETAACVTSRESLTDFSRSIFGYDANNIEFLSTHFLKRSSISYARFQNYTIVKSPERVFAPKMIACHPVRFPFMVLNCHYMEGDNRLYKTSLVSENGEKVEALAACHMDTSEWSASSLLAFGLKPGPPMCHFFLTEHFAVVPSTSSSV